MQYYPEMYVRTSYGVAQEEVARALIRVQEQKLKAEIEIQTQEVKEMRRADLREQSKLQTMMLMKKPDGVLVLQKQRFGTPLAGELPIRNFKAELLLPVDEKEKRGYGIVEISFLYRNLRNVKLRFWQSKLGDSAYVRKAFKREGIGFGYSCSLEQWIQDELVQMAINDMCVRYLPWRCGWFKEGEEWKYATKPEECWMEVIRWMS